MTKTYVISYSTNALKVSTMRAQRAYVLHHVHALPAWRLTLVRWLYAIGLH